MMKKLQKLKAKKGFTLVELIVVIAIIGVLAAILIPTMMGYVKSANITSADQSAASVRKTIQNTLSALETKGCTVAVADDAEVTVKIDVSNSGGANAEFDVTMEEADDGINITGKDANGTEFTATDVCNALEAALEKDLAEMKAGTCGATFEKSNVIQVFYTSASADDLSEMAKIEAEDLSEDGIFSTPAGVIVGTAPKVYKDAAGGTEEADGE